MQAKHSGNLLFLFGSAMEFSPHGWENLLPFAIAIERSILSFHLPHPRKKSVQKEQIASDTQHRALFFSPLNSVLHSIIERKTSERAAMTTPEPYALHLCLLLFLMLLCNMKRERALHNEKRMFF
jgi:hypothetical protein